MGRKPDPKSPSNKFITSLFGTYIPRKDMTKEQDTRYTKVMSFIVSGNLERKRALIKDLSDSGLMCPKLKEIIEKNFPKPSKHTREQEGA